MTRKAGDRDAVDRSVGRGSAPRGHPSSARAVRRSGCRELVRTAGALGGPPVGRGHARGRNGERPGSSALPRTSGSPVPNGRRPARAVRARPPRVLVEGGNSDHGAHREVVGRPPGEDRRGLARPPRQLTQTLGPRALRNLILAISVQPGMSERIPSRLAVSLLVLTVMGVGCAMANGGSGGPGGFGHPAGLYDRALRVRSARAPL